MTALLVGISIALGIAFVAARLSKLWSGVLWGVVILFVLSVVWFFYFAEPETQDALTGFVFVVWGFVSSLVELVFGLGLLWSVAYFWWTIRSTSGNRGCVAVLAALAWTAFAVPGGLWLTFLGVFGLIS